MTNWGKAVGFLAVCLTWFAASQMDPEPMPGQYTTTDMPEPEPMDMGEQQVVHTVTVEVTFSNLTALMSEADLIAQLTQGVLGASGAGTNVTVVIHYIVIESVYGGLPVLIIDNIIDAYAGMVSVNINQVFVNNQAHSSLRRLSMDANTQAKIQNDAGVDVVSKGQQISAAQSGSAMQAALAAQNNTAYGGANISLSTPPFAKISATAHVTGTNTPPQVQDLQNQILANLPPGAGASVTANVSSVGLPACDLSQLGCQTAATSLGKSLGGLNWPFAGDYSETGCYYYNSGEFSGIAFYGTLSNGGEITAESQLTMMASPKYRICGVTGGVAATTTMAGAPATTAGSPAATTVSNNIEESDNAVIASMTAIWAIICAFSMS